VNQVYEFTYESLPDVQAYLKRMEYNGSLELSRETLNALIYAHQCTIPFENLDCYEFKKEIKLDIEPLFDKVVHQKRGGYCFELNGLFMLLLRGLGFDAYSCVCRVAARRDFLSPISHRGCLVNLGGKQYFCDVGQGGPMAPFAVELSDERQTFYGETYWIVPAEAGWKMLVRRKGAGFADTGEEGAEEQGVVIFGQLPFLAEDFNALSRNFSTNPTSVFLQNRIVYLRTPGGYKGLRNDTLTLLQNGEKQVRTIEPAELDQVLQEHFGIVLPR
jgi:N-hydroxyarylamine O-acetyltransferase